MRRTFICWSLVVACLTALAGRPSRGEVGRNDKPLAVISIANYDRLIADVELIGKLAGRPGLADGLQGMLAVVTQGQGLSGLDTSRPWGAVLAADGSESKGYAFLPVDDLQAFQDVFRPYINAIDDLDDGMFRVRGKQRRQTIYAKHTQTGWLFICNTADGLSAIPDNPVVLLGDLVANYDVACHVNLNRLPTAQRQEWMERLRERAEQDLEQRPGEDEFEFTMRQIIGRQLLKNWHPLVDDVNGLTAGWLVKGDPDDRAVAFELEVTARQDSPTSRALGEWAEAQTRFAGFRLPTATLSGNLTACYRLQDHSPVEELISAVRAKAFADIDDRESSAERAQVGKEIVSGLLEVVQQTLASGRVDEVTSLILEPQAATLVGARHVADGSKLQETVTKFIKTVRQEHPEFVEETLHDEVDQISGVHFYMLTLDVPYDAQNREGLVRAIGDPLQVMIGIGEQSVYFAAGRDARKSLQQAMARSPSLATTDPVPVQLSWALQDTVEFFADAGQGKPQQRAAKLLERLGDARSDHDHVTFSIQPHENGLKLRLELEEGALQVLEALRGRP